MDSIVRNATHHAADAVLEMPGQLEPVGWLKYHFEEQFGADHWIHAHAAMFAVLKRISEKTGYHLNDIDDDVAAAKAMRDAVT